MEVSPTTGSKSATATSNINTTNLLLNSDFDYSKAPEACPIVLPLGFQLNQWRISDGSIIRIGETIALISSIDRIAADGNKGSGDNLNVNQFPVTNHKRPSRRKRPLPVSSEILSTDIIKDPTTKPENNTQIQQSSYPATISSKVIDGFIKSTEIKKPSNSNAIHQLRDSGGTSIAAQADGICRKVDVPTIASETDVIIGWIDPCRHPTIIAGLCAVCGTKVSNNVPVTEEGTSSTISSSSYSAGTEMSTENNMNQNMTLMTVSGMTVTVSGCESKRMALEDTKRLEGIKKLSLVLDLDHTLLHATADPRADVQCRHRTDVRRLVLPFMMVDGNNATMHPPQQYQPGWLLQQHFVKLRPHLKEFLEQAMENYEMGVYTAGTRDYAEQVTILLARHLLGVERDQVELEQLRQRLAQVEHKHQQQQIAQKNNAAAIEEEKGEPGNETQESKNGSKRKRVQFEELPVATKTDEMLLDELEKLKAELIEAETLERQAQDLRRRLFGSRVMSRTESGESGRHVKSLKRIFPCGGSMAAVIDDREDVWANAEEISSRRLGEPPENLLLVRPYHWGLFHGYADVNNASGIDFSQVDTSSQVETDEQLLWTSKVLKSLHQKYYHHAIPSQRTVPMILEDMRSEVLKGCVIVLSGLIPLSKQQIVDQNQPRPSFVRYAESLGAKVQSNVSEEVTHVVAANDGTDKILSARKIKGCYVVKPSWLVECYWSMTRRDESTHLLGTAWKMTPNEANLVKSHTDHIDLHDAHNELVSPTHLLEPALKKIPIEANLKQKLGDDKTDQIYLYQVHNEVSPTSDDIEDDDDDDFAAELENEFLNEDDDDDM